jgi:hypothetical protein
MMPAAAYSALSAAIPKTGSVPLCNIRVTDAKEVGVRNPAEETFCHPDTQFNTKTRAIVKPSNLESTAPRTGPFPQPAPLQSGPFPATTFFHGLPGISPNLPVAIPHTKNQPIWHSAWTNGVFENGWHAGSSKDPQLANAGRGIVKEQAVDSRVYRGKTPLSCFV